MGNFINKNKAKSSNSKKVFTGVSKIQSISTKKVIHKAKVLTPSDVEANRCMAYSYLSL
ncbi:hypothetical protein [Lutibacter sp. B1]|uniref:hypothetical protein n=1 Tax=Lutibacter sp. B1 TaxID=2725996 RepID=UPI001456B4FD|nr:hypothetical protein [Lutibacter sp. B1]